MIARRITPLFLLSCILGCFEVNAAAQTALPEIDVKEIDARLERLVRERGMVGLGVAIVEKGELVHVKGYGLTRAGEPERVTSETVFRWASLSKSVAGTLVAKLDETGQLSLSGPASRYSKSLRLPGGGESVATVQNVLSHQLGIIRNAYDNQLEAGRDPEAIRKTLGELQLQCEVGTCHGYQNVAFDASAEMIESATGKTYLQATKEALFKPLGMNSVTMSVKGLTGSARWARPHNSAGKYVFRTIKDSYFNVPAAGGMASNIRDLGLWMRAQMGLNADVISKGVLGQTHDGRVDTPREQTRIARYYPYLSEAEYGLGWRVYEYAGRKVVGHRGAVNGYRALILFDPAAQTGVAAMWNSGSNQPVGLQMEIMDMAYGLPARDWLYLDGGPNLSSVKTLARKYVSAKLASYRLPKDIPVPSLSPAVNKLAVSSEEFARDDNKTPTYFVSASFKYWPSPSP